MTKNRLLKNKVNRKQILFKRPLKTMNLFDQNINLWKNQKIRIIE